MAAPRKNTPCWSDVKARLTHFDRTGLVGLLQDLYATNKDNQAFLHARFGLSDDVLKSYKATLDRRLRPDFFKKQDTSVARAKKALSDYQKAVGHPEGLAKLMVFYCGCAAGFSNDVGLQDESYFDALVRHVRTSLENHRHLARSRASRVPEASGRGSTHQSQLWLRCWRRCGRVAGQIRRQRFNTQLLTAGNLTNLS